MYFLEELHIFVCRNAWERNQTKTSLHGSNVSSGEKILLKEKLDKFRLEACIKL